MKKIILLSCWVPCCVSAMISPSYENKNAIEKEPAKNGWLICEKFLSLQRNIHNAITEKCAQDAAIILDRCINDIWSFDNIIKMYPEEWATSLGRQKESLLEFAQNLWNEKYPDKKYGTVAFRCLLTNKEGNIRFLDFVEYQFYMHIDSQDLSVVKKVVAAIDQQTEQYEACSDRQKRIIAKKMGILRAHADELEVAITKN